MAGNRFQALFWAFGLGVMTALVVGSVVRVPRGMSPMQFTFGLVAVSWLLLAVVAIRQFEQWDALGPNVGFVVFFTSLFVGVVILGGTPRFLVGGEGLLTTVAQLLGSAVAVGITIWLCFFGGAWTVLQRLAPALGIEIRSRNA